MPRNRNKYRRESLTEVRVNGQNIRVSPYLAQYTADGKGEAEHVRLMTEALVVNRLEPEIADEYLALSEGRNPLSAAVRAKKPSTNSPDPSLSTNASPRNNMGDFASDGETPGNPSQHSSEAQT